MNTVFKKLTNLKRKPHIRKTVDFTRKAAGSVHRFAQNAAYRIKHAAIICAAALVVFFCYLYNFCGRIPACFMGRKEK